MAAQKIQTGTISAIKGRHGIEQKQELLTFALKSKINSECC